MGSLLLLEPARAQATPDLPDSLEVQRQLDIQRREAQQREQASTAPSVHSNSPTASLRLPVKGEQPCSIVTHMQLQGPSKSRFDWLQPLFKPFANHCLGTQSLQALQDNLNNSLEAAGYVTSRAAIADPAIQNGTAHFHLIAGRLGRFRLVAPRSEATGIDDASNALPSTEPTEITTWPDTTAWLMAVPARSGEVFNVRNLDHGAENIQRLGYAIEQYIVPQIDGHIGTDAVHDVVVAWVPPQRRWQVSLGIDNSSSPSFGRSHLSAQFGVANLLGLADQIFLSLGSNAEATGSQRKQYSHYLSFSIPWGFHRIGISNNRSQSALGLQGTTTSFTHRRQDSETQLEWAYTFFRDGHYKLATEFTHGWRNGESHIEDTELVVQRRHAHTRGLALNVSWIDSGQQLQTSLGVTQTIRNQRKDDDFYFIDEARHSTTRRWSGQWLRTFSAWGKSGTYSLQWDVQSTRHPTPLSPDIALGGRYTVRGFTGDQSLTASDGLWVRNELQLNGWQGGKWGWITPYIGLDGGKVWGTNAPPNGPSGQRWLAGAVIGLRGRWATARTIGGECSIDVAVATPLHGMRMEWSNRPRLVPYVSVIFSL